LLLRTFHQFQCLPTASMPTTSPQMKYVRCRSGKVYEDMSKLQQCYSRIKNILGDDTEPFASVELVEKYRQYWKPADVKIILLAESHVFTTDNDRDITLPAIKDLPSYPIEYAKFVYCLAYGEVEMTGSCHHPRRDGTPQFWKIFYSCINEVSCLEDFKPILSKTPFEQRVQNKIAVLRQMRNAGIWLIDTSIVALYNNGRKPPFNTMQEVISASWHGYTRDWITGEKPSHVICIGKGVSKVVEDDVKGIVSSKNVTIIAQPNAHLSGEEHMRNFQEYSRICNGRNAS